MPGLTLAELIRRRMDRLGLTQVEMTRRYSIRQATISAVVNGRGDARSVQRVVDALGGLESVRWVNRQV